MSTTYRALRASAAAVALSLFATVGATAQESARERAQRTLPPQVYENIEALATEVSASGVPGDPLFSKALEGRAKGVPPGRLLPAIRQYANRLGIARGALGPEASIPTIVAGADAIQRGVSAEVLRSLPRDRPRSPVALLVLAELMESGVPTDRAVALVRQAMVQRTRDAQMLNIPARVRRLIRDGVPPQEAIDRVRRQLRRLRGSNLGPVLSPSDAYYTDRLRRLTTGTSTIG